MAQCPNCARKLKLTDWRQNCPGCGVNLLMYDVQERMMKDADKAEVQNYHFQKKLDRVKASFIGSKLAIARIVTSIIPILAILLPLVSVRAAEPLAPFEGGFSLFSVFGDFIENFDVNVLLSLFGQNRSVQMLLISVAFFALSVVVILLHLVLLTLSCSKRGKARNLTLDILIMTFAVLSAVCFAVMPDSDILSGGLHVGAFVYIALTAVNFAVDVLTFKKGIEVHHKPCFVGGIPIEEYFAMVESGMSEQQLRAEMYKRLKAIQSEKDREIAAADEKERERIMAVLERADGEPQPEDAVNDKYLLKAEKKKRKAAEKLAALEKKLDGAKNDPKKVKALYKKRLLLRSKACTLTKEDLASIPGVSSAGEQAAAEYELFFFKSGLSRATGGKFGVLTLILFLVFACVLPYAVNGIIKDARWDKQYNELFQSGYEAFVPAEGQTKTDYVLSEAEASQTIGYTKLGNDNIVLFMFIALACLAIAIYTFGRDKKTLKMITDGTYRLQNIVPEELRIFTTEGKVQYRVKYLMDGIEESRFVSECVYRFLKEEKKATLIVAGSKKSFFAEEGMIIPCLSYECEEVRDA